MVKQGLRYPRKGSVTSTIEGDLENFSGVEKLARFSGKIALLSYRGIDSHGLVATEQAGVSIRFDTRDRAQLYYAIPFDHGREARDQMFWRTRRRLSAAKTPEQRNKLFQQLLQEGWRGHGSVPGNTHTPHNQQ